MTEPDRPDREAIERQAADWIVRLADPALSAGARAGLRRERDGWLAASPDHGEAYRDIDHAWALLREAAQAAGTLRPEHEPEAATPERPTPERPTPERPTPERPTPERPTPERPTLSRSVPERPRPRRWLAAGLRLCLVLGLAAGLAFSLAHLYGVDPLLAFRADHWTGPGETREVALGDGSRVLLGSSSAIALERDGTAPRIRLLQGEAEFTLAAAPPAGGGARAYAAEAAGVEVAGVEVAGIASSSPDAEAEGDRGDEGLPAEAAPSTRFQLRRAGADTVVTVLGDPVRVTRSARPEPASVVLGQGERLTMPADSTPGILETVDLARAGDWRDRRLVFDRRPLSEVIAELNRHRRGRILLADPALGRRQVSGEFRIGELELAPERLARQLGATSLELPLVSLLY